MHQRPPADPYNKDDLLVTATTTTQVAMTQPEQQQLVDRLVADIDGDDEYHGVTEEEISDDSGAEDCEGQTSRHETDLFDDVFGGGDDDAYEQASSHSTAFSATAATHNTDTHAHPSDMNRLQQEHSTAGYREGLSAGKNASLQTGFDEGYSLGAALGLAVGELLGLVEGLLSFQMESDNQGAEEGALLARARHELTMQALYAPAYFAPDGTWVYDVAGADENGENDESKTIFDVARAHPLVRSWRATVDKELSRRGVRWAKPGEEAELAAVLGLTEDEPNKEPKKVTASSSAAGAAAAEPSEPAARAPPSNTSALDW